MAILPPAKWQRNLAQSRILCLTWFPNSEMNYNDDLAARYT
jgi:hypothetical protein